MSCRKPGKSKPSSGQSENSAVLARCRGESASSGTGEAGGVRGVDWIHPAGATTSNNRFASGLALRIEAVFVNGF